MAIHLLNHISIMNIPEKNKNKINCIVLIRIYKLAWIKTKVEVAELKLTYYMLKHVFKNEKL